MMFDGDGDDAIADLLKQATAQAGDKHYEEAIATLRDAYARMETASQEWPIETYFRLGRYLHLSGHYEEAVAWLRQLHDTLDARYDAREQIYKQWGWMQGRGKPAKIPKTVRNAERKIIKREIEVYAERQAKIEARKK